MKDVTWNDTLDRVSWRIDVRTLSKTTTSNTSTATSQAGESDEPIAFLELTTKAPTSAQTNGGGSSKSKNAKFEMNRAEVGKMLDSLNEIQQVFEAAM